MHNTLLLLPLLLLPLVPAKAEEPAALRLRQAESRWRTFFGTRVLVGTSGGSASASRTPVLQPARPVPRKRSEMTSRDGDWI